MAKTKLEAAQFLDEWRERMAPHEARIETGIREHRQSDVELKLTDGAGRPVAGATVELTQRSHAFSFGANSFMLGGYDSDAENNTWVERYTQLFNHTVVGFFWPAYEPERGKLRFDADSEPMYRRPPVDTVLDWCAAHGLTPKGHNLFWATNRGLTPPKWLPSDPEQWKPHIRRHFEDIADRYAGRLDGWDVVNEFFQRGYGTPTLPRDYGAWCYQQADELFPNDRLFVNEAQGYVWGQFKHEDSPYHLLIENLKYKGCRVDGIGMQHHVWGQLHEVARNLLELEYRPGHELTVLDHYAGFGLPIHISEITIASAGEIDRGQDVQAELARDFYRLWFSHPAVEAIVWWNLADGHAFGDEARFEGGLLRPDLSPKPAYDALDRLINHDWRTQRTLTTDAAGVARFRGFHGAYDATVGAETHAIRVPPGTIPAETTRIELALKG